MSERNGGKTAEWAYGGMTQGASKLLAYPDISPLDDEKHVFPTLRTFLWYLPRINWRIVLPYKSILHCHGVSGKVLCSRNPKWYSIPYRIFFWSHKVVCGLSDFSNQCLTVDLLYSPFDMLYITPYIEVISCSSHTAPGDEPLRSSAYRSYLHHIPNTCQNPPICLLYIVRVKPNGISKIESTFKINFDYKWKRKMKSRCRFAKMEENART